VPAIEAILFDIGGVFFPWPPPSYFADWAARLRIAPEEFAALLWHGPDIEAANVGAISAEEYCQRGARRLNVAEAAVVACVEGAFAGTVDETLVNHVRALHVRRPDLRFAAVSNNWSFARRLLAARGIADLFDVITISAEVGVCKPAPAIFQVALVELGVTAAQAIFVDDSVECVQAAQNLGLRTVHFRGTEPAVAALDTLLLQAPT
jgi:putative hydrolase of the HAD superfamily